MSVLRKSIIFQILIMSASLFAGYVIAYLTIHFKKPETTLPIKFPLENLLSISQQHIYDKNWHCEGSEKNHTVGFVLASILRLNSQSHLNQISAACQYAVDIKSCSISVTACRPWKNTECESKILQFEIDQIGKIKTDKIKCIELP